MATQNKKSNASLIDSTTNKALVLSTKANDLALKSTENLFSKSFELAEKGLNFSGKVIKKGLKLTAAQQNMFFDLMDSAKDKLVKKTKKTKKSK